MVRGINDTLYYKELNSEAFHFPNGPSAHAIWTYRPLLSDHCWYTASDVVVLFMIHYRFINLIPPISEPSYSPLGVHYDSPSSMIPGNAEPSE